jgi:hypothetical protein
VIVMPGGVTVGTEQDAFLQLSLDACPASRVGSGQAELFIDRIDMVDVHGCEAPVIPTVDALPTEQADDLNLKIEPPVVYQA